MSHRLSADSTRRGGAQRFAVALNEAMSRRNVSAKRLAFALGGAGGTTTSINNYRHGHNIPRLETAQRLAEALDAPRLVELAIAARTLSCDNCHQEFVTQAGTPQRYCTKECQRLAAMKRTGSTRTRAVAAERSLSLYRDSVGDYCRGCEPEGTCRTSDCALRPVSPLPLQALGLTPLRPIPTERKPNPPDWLANVRATRWTPEAKRVASESQRARFSNMTDAERRAFGSAVSAGRRRTA